MYPVQGHALGATLQLNVKYVCFKRRAGELHCFILSNMA